MKHAASLTVTTLVFAIAATSSAKPPSAPAPAASSGTATKAPSSSLPSSSKANASVYFKPSKDGTDKSGTFDKTAATLKCLYGGRKPDYDFKVQIKDGLVFCASAWDEKYTSEVFCANGTLVTDDKLPPAAKAKYGDADACLKAGAPPNDVSSYEDIRCGTNSTGGGFVRQKRPGLDICEKVIANMRLQTLNNDHNGVRLPTVVGVGKVVVPTPEQIAGVAFTCPSNAALEQVDNGAVCKKK